MPITTRIIFPDEWERLRAPFKKLFGEDKEPPSSDMCLACAVQENNGEIIGFLFLQLIPHMEPFGSTGGASFKELKKCIDDYLTAVDSITYYAHFIDNPVGEAVARHNGFNPVGVLYSGSPKR